MQSKTKSQKVFAVFIEEIENVILNVFLKKDSKYGNTKEQKSVQSWGAKMLECLLYCISMLKKPRKLRHTNKPI